MEDYGFDLPTYDGIVSVNVILEAVEFDNADGLRYMASKQMIPTISIQLDDRCEEFFDCIDILRNSGCTVSFLDDSFSY
jgi:hypothetical protein